MPPARTGRSTRSWRRSTRRAASSRRSRSRPRRSSLTTSCGASTSGPRVSGEIGDLQPLALRGGARRPGPRPRAQGGLVEALRPDQRCSRRPSPTRARRSSSSSCSIDRDEQRARFQARYDDPTKRWKFSLGDLQERKLWDDYQAAFDDARRGRRPPGRRGTSSRPTTSGSGTWPCHRSSPRRWPV